MMITFRISWIDTYHRNHCYCIMLLLHVKCQFIPGTWTHVLFVVWLAEYPYTIAVNVIKYKRGNLKEQWQHGIPWKWDSCVGTYSILSPLVQKYLSIQGHRWWQYHIQLDLHSALYMVAMTTFLWHPNLCLWDFLTAYYHLFKNMLFWGVNLLL